MSTRPTTTRSATSRPTREEHPLPAVVMHWAHLVALAVLIATGFYIYNPFYPRGMGINQLLHFTFMWVFLLTAVTRVYWAFFGAGSAAGSSRLKVRDAHWFWVEKGSRHKFREQLKYYLFLRRSHPRFAKYNPLQKLTYVSWLVLMVPITLTGLAIWTPTQSFLEPLTYALGGPAAMHTYHYLIMWLFIITVALHIYLVFVEEIREVPLMFWWGERKNKRRQGAEGKRS